jgi:hypothetical protein
LGAGLTIHSYKKFNVTKSQRGGQGPNWSVQPYDDDDDGDDILISAGMNFRDKKKFRYYIPAYTGPFRTLPTFVSQTVITLLKLRQINIILYFHVGQVAKHLRNGSITTNDTILI